MMEFRRMKRRSVRAALLALTLSAALAGSAHAQDTIQIGLSTKAWFPSFVAQLTADQGFFKDAGIKAELTVYQSGSEALTAVAAGSADIISTNPSIVANGRAAGVNTKMVALLATRNYGWQLLVPPKSTIKDAADLAGKKIGITSAGSNTDLLARWTQRKYGIAFTTVPLGGAGLVPNLISGNVDAVIVYPPLGYQVVQDGNGKVVFDYGQEMPEHAEAGWAASDAFARSHADTLKKALKALYRGVDYIKRNPAAVIPKIAAFDGVAEPVAKTEYEMTFLHLTGDGAMTPALVQASLDLFDVKVKGKAPDAKDLYTTGLTPIDVKK